MTQHERQDKMTYREWKLSKSYMISVFRYKINVKLIKKVRVERKCKHFQLEFNSFSKMRNKYVVIKTVRYARFFLLLHSISLTLPYKKRNNFHNNQHETILMWSILYKCDKIRTENNINKLKDKLWFLLQ